MNSFDQIVLTVDQSVLEDIADTLGSDLNLEEFDSDSITNMLKHHLESHLEEYLANLSIEPAKILPHRLLFEIENSADNSLELAQAA